MSGPPKRLTPMQMKFAQLIVYGIEGNPITKTEAAKRAGYSDAANEGSKMTNPKHYPLVCAHISNLRDELRQKYDITYEGHLEELGKIRDQGKKDGRNLAAAATTEIARGKVGGFYIDQKIIRHGNIDDIKNGIKNHFWNKEQAVLLSKVLKNCKNQCYKCHKCDDLFETKKVDSILEL